MVQQASKVRVVGPLAPFQAGFADALARRGYTPLSAANQLRVMGHLSRWLDGGELVASDLVPATVQAYLVARRAVGYTCWLSPRGLAPLLDHLRAVGVAPPPAVPVVSGALDELLEGYRRYLVTERGLVAGTVRYYLPEARLFVSGWVGADGSRLDRLSAAEVTAFVVDQCARRSVGSAKILVTVLRSLLRFLLLDGLVAVDLSGAVPSVAGWRGSHLPKGIGPAQRSALLASRAGPNAVDRRDRAILLVLTRLGLRAVEVARLRLDDIDWRRGEITVRGKGRRDERLPLPVDVGAAIVDYLRHGRPVSVARTVFLNVRAPSASMTDSGVKQVVRQAGVRAGLGGLGAHRLRHTLATELLRAQAPLVEVGQLLRHRSTATTAIYAKVDRVALRDLALPWPQAVTA